jgi:hypothetical protein
MRVSACACSMGVLVDRAPAVRALGFEQRGNAACLVKLPCELVEPPEQFGVLQFVLVAVELGYAPRIA